MKETIVITFQHSIREAESIATYLGADVEEYTPDVFEEVFQHRKRIVALMSMGIVVRKIASLLRDKWTDPAVVVVSPDCRFAIPLLGGHHGANELARELEGCGMTPVITTATESRGRESVEAIAGKTGMEILNRDSTRQVNAALLNADIPVHAVQGPAVVLAGADVSVLIKKGTYSVGVGCRKGIRAAEVVEAIRAALSEAGISEKDILIYATTIKKFNEAGLTEGVGLLSGNLIFLEDDTINAQTGLGPSRATRIGLSGVAEPCALAVAKKKELVMGKKVYGRVTVAIAR